MKFYVCKRCGNIIYKIKDSKVPVVCCGEKMEELIPGVTDGALEKHVPVISINNNVVTVSVGSIKHPMQDVHYIEWIILETTKNIYIRHLTPSDEPVAVFNINEDEEIISSYEYCNLHGLWKKDR